jgi:hypothetical protein
MLEKDLHNQRSWDLCIIKYDSDNDVEPPLNYKEATERGVDLAGIHHLLTYKLPL